MTASARRATRRATCSFAAWRARAAAVSSRRCWFATSGSRRSAIQRAPLALWTAAPTRWTDPGGDVVITASIPSRRAMRIAAGIAVRFQVTLASGRRRRRAVTCAWTSTRSRPSAARSSSAGFRARGPMYRARWIHACVGHAQLGVAVHPLRVVRGEHVRLDAERRQVLRELERALHASSARRREVHRHEQHLHGCEA